jgi:hypothetical protein
MDRVVTPDGVSLVMTMLATDVWTVARSWWPLATAVFIVPMLFGVIKKLTRG